ncbi:MAG: 2-oxoacid:acceptor oxidoreductase family protein [Phycisphaerales bacterium]|nr:2-oxoacid:acceptor oxidoreductase family protein [Phycisphaerales bacterium]
MPMLTTLKNDMCYCPGCSHGLLLERLAAATERIGLTPGQVCIVSDIGCIGTADRYFESHTFHGLHGRSFTYAEGIKRARPELTVIVLVGDGGCGIGTAHLVHSARRNVGVKVLVCNNFNFGMTGGQHSPTTPEFGRTSTTPWGAAERPFDICRTAMAAGAGFIARDSVHADSATDCIEAALRSPDFTLVDLWELCVAYYVSTNKLPPTGLVELSNRLDMPFGILQDSQAASPPPPPDTAKSKARDADENPADSSPAPPLRWAQRTEICIAGSAGQHIRSAAGVIGEIAVAGGLFAAQQDDFPITVRKGHSISNLIVSSEPILYAALDHPDVLIILSDDGLKRLGRLDRLSPSCLILADDTLALPPTPATVRRIPAEKFSRGAGKAAAALAVLAHALALTGRVAPDDLLATGRVALAGKYRDANLRAIEFGLTFAAPTETPAAGVAGSIP